LNRELLKLGFLFAAAIGPLAACSGTSNPPGPAEAGPDGTSAEGGKPEAGPRDGSAADADAAGDAGILEAGHDASDGSTAHDAAEGGPTGDAAEAAAPNAALALSAGANGNACALTVADGVECWTYNGSGVAAAPVAGGAGSVTALSGGGGFTDDYEAATDVFFCAITGAGGLDCWGNNADSELGNGSQTNTAIYTVPGLVTGLTSGVMAVSAGAGNSVSACAVAGGDVQCWGNNGGVLGNGTTASTSALPVPVTGFTGTVTAVSVGGGFACALVTGGGVECWGTNTYGELGNGTTASSVTPVQVTGLTSGVTAISAAGQLRLRPDVGRSRLVLGLRRRRRARKRRDRKQLGSGAGYEPHERRDRPVGGGKVRVCGHRRRRRVLGLQRRRRTREQFHHKQSHSGASRDARKRRDLRVGGILSRRDGREGGNDPPRFQLD